MSGRPLEGTPLTDAEREALALAAGGLTYAQIGRRIHLSEVGVKARIHRAAAKLGAASLTQAVHLATLRGHIGWRPDCGRPSGYDTHLSNGEPPDLLCRNAKPNGTGIHGEMSSTVSVEYLGTVNRLLRAERQGALEEVVAELERLCGQAYFREQGFEPGIRTAISAVRRLIDSRYIRAAEPDDAPSPRTELLAAAIQALPVDRRREADPIQQAG